MTCLKLNLLAFLFLVIAALATGIDTDKLGETINCSCDKDGKPCDIDGYVGSSVIYEDDSVRIWNFTLLGSRTDDKHAST